MILGTVGIPTILLLLLISMPFLDVRRRAAPGAGARSRWSRPSSSIISMGILTYQGATAKESLGIGAQAVVPTWAKKQGFANNPTAVAGAKLFASVGCMNCHTYLGEGTQQRRALRI